MKKIISVVKNLAANQIQRAVLKQKNEWPVTSFPIYFQPERPEKDTLEEKSKS